MQSTKSFSITLVTVPSKEASEKISKSLVEKDLAACVNIIPSVQSVYKWEGENKY
ncbi:MAG: divalent cation tolerance protein CutA [bacterium]